MAASDRLQAHHALRSQQKRDAVLLAARAMIRQGLAIEWVTLAARAGVSEKFVHDPKHADVKAQIKELIAEASGRAAEHAQAQGEATIASLRVELLNLRGALSRKDRQLVFLERRLSRSTGQALEAELPRQPGSILEQAERAQQRALELEARVRELDAIIDERDREILGLRDALRKTIRDANASS
jgi:hypothetical protein